jgi:hypothetical protein
VRGFFDGRINRDIENRFTGFFRVHAGHKAVFAVGVFLAFFSVELTGFAGDTLGNDLGIFVDEDGHFPNPLGVSSNALGDRFNQFFL